MNNVSVAITADVADLQVKRAILSSELRAANKDLNDFAKTARTSGSTDELRAGMLKAAEAATKVRAQVHGLDGELRHLSDHQGFGKAMDNVFDRSRLAVLEAGTAKIPLFGSAIEALGPAGLAAAAGLAAMAFAAHEAIKSAEWAEQLKRASVTLGLTTTQLQEFDFVLNAMGIDVAKGREALGGLEKTIGLVMEGAARKQQLKQFVDVLKITPDDLRGWGTLEEQLPHILDALAKLDPEERAATAGRLKIDPEVLTSMIEARGRLHELIDEAHKYGIVISADVVNKSAESASKMREWKAVIDGELRVAFIELAPEIVGAAQAVAGLARDFADTIKGVEHFWGSVKDAIGPIISLVSWVNDLSGKLEHMVSPLSQVVGLLKELGHSDTAAADDLNSINEKLKAADAADRPKPKQRVPDAGKKGPGVVSIWTEQLHAQEVASGEFFKDQTEKELAFWQSKLALTKKGSKDWLEVQAKIYEAQKKLAHEAYADHIADLNDRIEADKQAWTKEKADWDEKLAFIKSKYGEESREFRDAHKAFEAAERQHQQTMLEIERTATNEHIAELKANLATDEAIRAEQANTAKSQIEHHAKTSGDPFAEIKAAAQIMALDKQAAAQKIADTKTAYDAESAALAKELAAEVAAHDTESTKYATLIAKKEQLDNAYYNKRRQLEQQAASQEVADQQKIVDAWHAKIDPAVSGTGDIIKGLVNGTMTWHQALLKVGDALENVVLHAAEKAVEDWIVKLIVGQSAQAATGTAMALSNAAVAGSAAYAATAIIPIVGPALAPAAAAAAYTGAAAYAPLASLDQGTNVVPSDMIAQIHAGERIMPAADNASLMAAVANSNVSNTNNSGDRHIHLHNSPTINGGGDFEEMLSRNHTALASTLGHMARSGRLDAVFKAVASR